MIALLVAAVLAAAHPGPQRISVARTFQLPAGRTHAAFDFRVHARFPDRARLVVSRDARVSVTARSHNGAIRLWIATRPWTMWWHHAWAGHCRHKAGRDVCLEQFERCPLFQGRWRATVRKTSAAPALVRARFVFVR